MGTKNYNNYSDMITFTRASSGTALAKISYGANLNPAFSNYLIIGTGTWAASGSDYVFEDTVGSQVRPGVSWPTNTLPAGTYRAEIVVASITGATQVRVDGIGGDQLLGVGTHSFVFTTTTTSFVRIRIEDTSTTTGDGFAITSVSVRPVLYDQPDGTLQLFNYPTNQPRVEYDYQGNRLGLLVEEARTNYARNSTLFTGSGWSLIDAAVSAGFSAPDGSTDAYKFIPSSSATVNARLFQGTASIPAGSVTGSFYAKAGELNSILLCGYTGSGYQSAYFNLETGQVIGTFGGPDDYSITQITDDGWFRVSVTITNVSNYHINISAGMDDDFFDSTSVQNGANWNSVNGIYIYGAQVEAGSFPTSYIPTAGSTVTRAADVASIGVGAFGYNKGAGTIVYEAHQAVLPTGGVAYGAFDLVKTGHLERVYSLFESSRHLFVRDATTVAVDLDVGDLPTGSAHKVGTSFKKDNFGAVIDGGTVVTDTLGNMPVPATDLYIGGLSLGPYPLNGHISSIAYYPRRLTDAQIKALTSPPETPTLSLTFDDSTTSYLETSIHG